MPDVVVAASILGRRIRAVLRILPAIERSLVQRMRPGIASHEGESAPCPLGQSCLESVIFRLVTVRQKIDHCQVGEARATCARSTLRDRAVVSEWPPELLATIIQRRVYLVDVIHAVQLGSFAPHVTNLQRRVAGNGSLNVQVPVAYIGSAQIPIHSQNAAWARGRAIGRRAEHWPGN